MASFHSILDSYRCGDLIVYICCAAPNEMIALNATVNYNFRRSGRKVHKVGEFPLRKEGHSVSLKACINQLNELKPSQRRLAMMALLASSVDRVRLLETNDKRISVVAEFALSPVLETEEFWEVVANAGSFPTASLSLLSSVSNNEFGERLNAAFSNVDLLTDESGRVLVSIQHKPPLDGENLLTLGEKDSVPLLDVAPRNNHDGPFLSAERAANLLGVAKSTVTRRIKKNELIGFQSFTNALRIPEEQFLEGSVVLGVPEILALFTKESATGATYANHKGAWNFLSTVVSPGGPEPRPIDKLRASVRKGNSSVVLAELSRVKESFDYGDHI